MIYFDNAATTGHKPQSVINAINYAIKNLSANPGRSGHFLSEKAAQAVYNTRESVSNFFDSDGAETVIFTQNCTQSINFVLKGILERNDHIIVSDLEHNAVMRPLVALGVDYTLASVSFTNDDITLQNFKSAIKSNTKMIFCTAASNVFGKKLPLEKIGDLCREKGILFGVDAAQGAGHMEINMKKMNIDYLCLAPHKGLYSPMGIGILIARKPIKKTIIEGGTGTNSLSLIQPNVIPEMLESGTVNLPAIAAIKKGIDFVKGRITYINEYEMFLVKRFYRNFQNSDAIFYTNPFDDGYVPVLSFNIQGHSSNVVAEHLNKNGFALRAGLHCAPTAHKKMGTLNSGTVRLAPSIFNNAKEVDNLINCLKKFLKNSKFAID